LSATGNLVDVVWANLYDLRCRVRRGCHGDIYGVVVTSGAVFQAERTRYSASNRGPVAAVSVDFQRAVKDATGTLIHDLLGCTYWSGCRRRRCGRGSLTLSWARTPGKQWQRPSFRSCAGAANVSVESLVAGP
jgi:hypothetical protein